MRTITSDGGVPDAFDLPRAVALAAEPARGIPLAPSPVPAWTDVLREQLAAVGLALRNEARVAAGIMVLLTVLFLLMDPGPGGMWLDPGMGVPMALMALLLPLAVWKGEGPGQRGYHHGMPVEPAAHAMIRVGAGLAWALAAVAAFFAWMWLLTMAAGGHVSQAEPWRWATPFAGATVLYLLGSALALVASHPWLWLGGIAIGCLFLDGFPTVGALRPLQELTEAILLGHYGIYTLLNGGYPRYHMIYDADRWLASVAIWLAIAVGAFVVAAHRQPES